MKKIFFGILAIAAFAACSNEEQIAAPKGQEIAFGDAFVDNATKAIYEGDTKLKEFYVWGNVTGNGNTVQLYENAKVYTSNDNPYNTVYNCDVKRYWTPSCAYKFVAIAHAKSVTLDADFLPTTITYEANGNDDLLLSEVVEASTDQECLITGANNGVVAFTMNHLLSKLHFEVNSSLGADYIVTPTSIKVSGVKKNGKYTLPTTSAPYKWELTDDETIEALELLNTDRVIIPVEQTLGITITYDIEFGGKKIVNGATKSANLTQSFAKNTVYNVTATISATAIDFTVSTVAGFDPETNVTVQ